jgi:hypothetical protein
MLPSLQGRAPFRCTNIRNVPHILLHPARQNRPHVVRASQQQQSSTAVPSVAAPGSFQWSSNISRRINLDLAVEEAVSGALSNQATGWEPELAVVFLSSAYVAEYDQLVDLLRQRVPSLKHVFGSSVSLTKQSLFTPGPCCSVLQDALLVPAQQRELLPQLCTPASCSCQ